MLSGFSVLPLGISRRLTVSHRAATLFRSSLASVVLLELYERLEINHWLYTDDGAFPRWAVMPPADVAPTLHWLCVHAWDGGHEWVTGLAALQGVVALFLLSGALPPPYRPHERWLRTAAAICWALQLSLMLRNPQLVFILDRYMHILLLLAACMPSGSRGGAGRCSAASCALGVQLLVIYIDAGWGKLTSPDAAWSVGAEVGALDTYMRHTPAARCVRWLLGATALRWAGAATAWLELLVAHPNP